MTVRELDLSLQQAAALLERLEWNGKSRAPEGALLREEAATVRATARAAGMPTDHWPSARRHPGSWMAELLCALPFAEW